ncbi:DUF3221 domain-containing protein [Paenibacillus sp. GYB004]|uniref:DUF3221 domain-containing protein n=1 Tax=Paenibacillus sp. GYB004 TaxID=2994393 RepID=UPI002F96ACA3
MESYRLKNCNRWLMLLAALLLSGAVAGCGSESAATSAVPEPAPVHQPMEGIPAPAQIDRTKVAKLAEIQKKLSSHFDELHKTYSIQVLLIGSGAEEVMMTIRSVNDVEKKITEEEVERIRQSLFAYAGETFPLKLEVRHCCTGSGDVTGKIKKIENERVLIVDETKKNGNTDDPVAVWVTLTEDGIVTKKGSGEKLSFDKLAEGQQVKAWSTGIMLQSYPGKTSAVKIEITDS